MYVYVCIAWSKVLFDCYFSSNILLNRLYLFRKVQITYHLNTGNNEISNTRNYVNRYWKIFAHNIAKIQIRQ